MKFKDKTILIAGASSGIGAATAKILAEQGAEVILLARNKNKLSEVARNLPNNKHLIHAADITQQKDRDLLLKELPMIDGFVFSIGIHSLLPARFIDERHIEMNFKPGIESLMLLMSGLLANKKFNHLASMVFVSSALSNHSRPGCALYSSVKAALEAYARTLALELAPKKIRVNIVAPGFLKSEMLEKTSTLAGKEAVNEIEKFHPLGLGTPEDVAEAIAFLLSDHARWITGSVLKMGIIA